MAWQKNGSGYKSVSSLSTQASELLCRQVYAGLGRRKIEVVYADMHDPPPLPGVNLLLVQVTSVAKESDGNAVKFEMYLVRNPEGVLALWEFDTLMKEGAFEDLAESSLKAILTEENEIILPPIETKN